MNNRKVKSRDFYYFKLLKTQRCFNCDDSLSSLYVLKDGYDTVICGYCLSLSLEELNCSEDYYSNDFNKKSMSDRDMNKKNGFKINTFLYCN